MISITSLLGLLGIFAVLTLTSMFIVAKYHEKKKREGLAAAADMKKEIEGVAKLNTDRTKNTVLELKHIQNWLNTDFVSDVAGALFSNIKLLEFKERINMKDAEYIESFTDSITLIQQLTGKKFQEAIDNVEATFTKELKTYVESKNG